MKKAILVGISAMTLGTVLMQTGLSVYASENSSTDNLVQIDKTNPKMLREYNQLKAEYGNVDLISKNLDPNKMTNEEKEFLNKVIELVVKEAVENGTLTSVSEKEAREQIYGLMTGVSSRNGHGAISEDVLAILINGLINVIGFAVGIGSLATALATMGKKAVRQVLKETIIPMLVKQVKDKTGLAIAGVFTGTVIDGIIDSIFDPGAWIAMRIDKIDLIPNNDWIELW